MITVQEELCKKDQFCASVCPMLVLKPNADTGYPEINKLNAGLCYSCGHCVAVCPHGALTHERNPLELAVSIEKELIINPAQADQFLRGRRSTRAYKRKEVDRATVQALINTASYAANSMNRQLLKWKVFLGRDKIEPILETAMEWAQHLVDGVIENKTPYPKEKIQLLMQAWYKTKKDSLFRGAPGLLVVMAHKDMGDRLMNPAMALAHFSLAASAWGIGTCLTGGFWHALQDYEPLRVQVGISDDYRYYYSMIFGYPKFRYHRIPTRKEPEIEWA
jgi:nitroreductase/NAD-dependent dihydropyrimidine dehydrogenase PreA subunit